MQRLTNGSSPKALKRLEGMLDDPETKGIAQIRAAQEVADRTPRQTTKPRDASPTK
jgi:hypothetical protein